MPSPAPPVQLPLPDDFEGLLRQLSAIYTKAYLERQALSTQVFALGGDNIGQGSVRLSDGAIGGHNGCPLKEDLPDRNLGSSLGANVASKIASPLSESTQTQTQTTSVHQLVFTREASEPTQHFKEVLGRDAFLSETDKVPGGEICLSETEEVLGREASWDETITVDRKPLATNSLANSDRHLKRCCWRAKGNRHLEQYERIAARYNHGSNVLCIQHIIRVTQAYHPSMNKDLSQTALAFFVNHSMEGIESDNIVTDSMEGLDGHEGIMQVPAFSLLAGKQSFPSDQVMQDFLPALLQIRHALWLEEEDYSAQTRGDQEDWVMQIMDIISTVLIVLNIVVLGITEDIQMSDTAHEIVDSAFTVFFTIELLFKLYICGPQKFYYGVAWRWNVYDSVLVLMALLDVAIMHTAMKSCKGGMRQGPECRVDVLLRLSRMARLLRLLRFEMFSDLRAMVSGVLGGMRMLFWAMFMFLAFIFLVAIVIRMTFGDMKIETDGVNYFQDRSFETVKWSFFTLFRCLTEGCSAPDGTPLQVHLLEQSGLVFMACYIGTFMFVTFGISNLIMALFIEHVTNSSMQKRKKEQEQNAAKMEAKLQEMMLQLAQPHRLFKSRKLGNRMNGIFKDLFDNWVKPKRLREVSARRKSSYLTKQMQNEDFLITRDIFNAWLKDDDMLDLLEEMDVDTAYKSRLFDCLDRDCSGELTIQEFVSGMMTLRGPPEKCDTVATLLCVRHQAELLSEINARLCRNDANMPSREQKNIDTTSRTGVFSF